MTSLDQFQHQGIVSAEYKCLETSFSRLRGYYLMMMGRHRHIRELPKHSLSDIALSPLPPIENTRSYIRSTYEQIPVRNNSVDGVILPYLLEYCESPEDLLNEIFRILIGEGKLLLFCFQRFHPWSWLNAPKSQRHLSFLCIKNLLNKSGFSIIRSEHIYYGSVIFFEAQKHIQCVTPLRPQWEMRELDKVFAKPAARQSRG
jgi:SAM-dependent methyltransferase